MPCGDLPATASQSRIPATLGQLGPADIRKANCTGLPTPLAYRALLPELASASPDAGMRIQVLRACGPASSIDPTASENLDGTRSQCLSPWMIRYFIQAAQLVTLDACFRLR
jgi:hypothetical protein